MRKESINRSAKHAARRKWLQSICFDKRVISLTGKIDIISLSEL